MIINGGEPELCGMAWCGMAWCGMLSEPYALRVRKSCPECSVQVLCCGVCRKVWKRVCAGKKNWCIHETQGCMATPTGKHKYEEVCWSLSRSSLTVCCTGISAFRFPIVDVLSLVAITSTMHMSMACLGSVGTCNVSVSREWDGHGQLVGQLVGRCTCSCRIC